MPGDRHSAGHRKLTILCLGFAATLPIFVGVAIVRVLLTRARAPLSGETTLLPETLAFAAVALILVAPLVKRWLHDPAATIVAFLLRQTTGVLGLAITLLTGDLVWCVALCVVALLAMGVDWPRRAAPHTLPP